MDTIKKTKIHFGDRTVDICIEEFIEINGKEYRLDIPRVWHSYSDSIADLKRMQKEQSGQTVEHVLKIWGDIPFDEDPETEETESLYDDAGDSINDDDDIENET